MEDREFIRLVEEYSGLVYRVAYCQLNNRADADDIMQDVFLALYTYEKHFADDGHVRAWLIRVTVNRCKNLLGSARYRTTVPIEAAENVPSQPQKSDSLLPVLSRLKPKYGVVLYLFYYEEYSVKEIASLLGIRQTAVTTRLSRARAQLKQLLIKEGHDELQ